MSKKNKTEKTKYTRSRIPKDLPEHKFSSRLKERMKESGITQKQLAAMLNVSIECVKDWCQGYTFPKDLNLGKLIEIFAPYSVDYFHGIIDAPNYDIKFISEYTGLSINAVMALKKDAIGKSFLFSNIFANADFNYKFVMCCRDVMLAADQYKIIFKEKEKTDNILKEEIISDYDFLKNKIELDNKLALQKSIYEINIRHAGIVIEDIIKGIFPINESSD